MFIACIVLPIYFYRLLNSNYPLLDPFDPNNDTTYHCLECPESCSGALLDIDKRMCWDFIKEDTYIVDIHRPITAFEVEKKEKRVLKKYYLTCNSGASPLLIFFQGFSYYHRFNIFWVYIKQYIFLLMIKLPYSKLFPDFSSNDLV
jgi:hypothetical protein